MGLLVLLRMPTPADAFLFFLFQWIEAVFCILTFGRFLCTDPPSEALSASPSCFPSASPSYFPLASPTVECSIYASSGNRELTSGLCILETFRASTKVGDPSLPEAVVEIVIDPETNRAWAQQGRDVFEFFEFDLATGSEISGTRFSTAEVNQFHGLEHVNGTLCGAGWTWIGGSSWNNSALCAVDPDEGTWTLIGSTGARPITGLAWTGSIMYGTSGAGYPPSELHKVDLNTSAATTICDDMQAGFGSLMCDARDGGKLYGSTLDGFIYEIDPASCAVTELWNTSFRPVSGLSLVCT